MSKSCPKCNFDANDDAKYCNGCGEQLTQLSKEINGIKKKFWKNCNIMSSLFISENNPINRNIVIKMITIIIIAIILLLIGIIDYKYDMMRN